mmetsp:Transcript_7809/g.18418  ORF Transcript_7809/g.18418 Transcript_7809/m.18418 type:complete len:207 (+) Transcript_7809:445-1065(+)
MVGHLPVSGFAHHPQHAARDHHGHLHQRQGSGRGHGRDPLAAGERAGDPLGAHRPRPARALVQDLGRLRRPPRRCTRSSLRPGRFPATPAADPPCRRPGGHRPWHAAGASAPPADPRHGVLSGPVRGGAGAEHRGRYERHQCHPFEARPLHQGDATAPGGGVQVPAVRGGGLGRTVLGDEHHAGGRGSDARCRGGHVRVRGGHGEG